MRHARSLRSLVQSLARNVRRSHKPAQVPHTRRFTPRMELLEDLTLPSTVFWTNPAGGNWHVPGNWSGGAVPGANDDAIIDMPAITVTHSQGTDTVRSLASRAAFVMSGGSLALATASVFHGSVNFFGGTLAGAGEVTVHGMFSWAGGLMTGAGQTHARGGLRFYAAFNNGLDGRALHNYGLAEWTGRGTLEMRNGATVHNRAGAMFNVTNLATFRLGWQDRVASTFHNQGTFRINYSGDVTSFTQNAYGLGVVLNNSGTLHLLTGHMNLGGGGLNTGVINVAATWRLNLAAGTYQWNAGTQVQGDGWVRMLGATTSVNADVSARNVELSSGMIAGTGTLTVTGMLSWSGGQFTGAGRTEVTAAGQLDISGAAPKYVEQRRLVNGGTANWTGAGDIVLRPSSQVVNLPGAIFHIRSDASMVQESTFASFINRGTLRKIISSGTTRLATWFENHGAVDVQSGGLRLHSGTSTGSFVAGPTTRMEFASPEPGGHLLQVTTSLAGAGTVIFSGQLTDVGGSYAVGATQLTGGAVIFRRGSTTGTLAVSAGSANLIGNLTVNGLFTWTGGVLRAAGQLTANGGLAISGAEPKVFRDGILVNSGLATWTGTGPLVFENGGGLHNRVGATFDAQSDAVMTFAGGLSGFLNQGTFRKSAGAGMTTFFGAMGNEGTVAVQTGQLALVGWSDNYGSITVAAGAGLIVDSLGFHPTSRLTGAGDLWFYGYVNFLDGVYDVTGATHVVGALFLIGSARTGTMQNSGLFFSIGQLTVTGGYTQQADAFTFLAGGAMTVGGLVDLQGGVFAGWGTISGNVRNNGRLSLGGAGWAGRLTINGDFTQTADGILDIEVGGQVAGVDYDQLQISGRALLDGILNVQLLEGYSADEDENYRVLTFGSRTGQFATINGLDLGGGYQLRPTWEANSLDLWTIRV